MNPQAAQTQPPVIVKKVVYKPRRSFTDFLLGTILLLVIIIALGAFISVSAWLYTYKALTQEKVVAELHIGKKTVKDGVPTTRVRYVPLKEQPAFFLGQETETDTEARQDLNGDQVFVDANFIRWENWVTLTGMNPVYRVYRVKSEYRSLEDRDKYKSSAFDLNGGADQFVTDLESNQQNFRWFIQSAFISSAGINVTDEDQSYNVIITKDAVVLEKK